MVFEDRCVGASSACAGAFFALGMFLGAANVTDSSF
jgi:hypothetical protein